MKTVLNVKTDKDIKEQAQILARYLGVPLSTVVNAYLKEFVQTGEFRLSREPQLRPTIRKEINRSIEESVTGKNISPIFRNANDATEWLNS